MPDNRQRGLSSSHQLPFKISLKWIETVMRYWIGFGALLLIAFIWIAAPTDAAEDVDMSKVRALAELPVKEILGDAPVPELPRASYWKTIRGSRVPVVVMFYSNVDPESQRLATLVRYISIKYKNKISYYRVMVAANGKPAQGIAADYEKSYSLDKTPGILFYDNDSQKMVLESEQYIDANFKEFRTPSLLLWKVYYNAVCSYIDKNILD
jgi:hypothetical protein